MADDYSQRAAKGQAYNLAVATAIADGKQHDNEFIVKQFLRHMQFAALVQKAKPDELAAIIETPTILNLFRQRGMTPAQVTAVIQKLYHQFEPDACAIEKNSFGEFHIQNLIEQTELKIVSHHTGKNKHDPFAGVPSLEMLFEHGKIKLPYKNTEDKVKTDCLINEFHSFGSGEHTDQVMAMWIAYRLMLRLLVSKRKTSAMMQGKRPTVKRRSIAR